MKPFLPPNSSDDLGGLLFPPHFSPGGDFIRTLSRLLSLLLLLCLLCAPGLADSDVAAADVPVLDLRASPRSRVSLPADESILTIVFPQMFFADACILLCDGHAAMIDAGGYAQEDSVLRAIRALNITEFDWVIATHPHHDHQPGFEAIAREYPIGRFLTSFPLNENVQMQKTVSVLSDLHVPIETATDGQLLSLGRAQISLLLPEGSGKTINNRSLLTLVQLDSCRLLMLGDLENMGQQALLDSGDDVHAQMLKYPHHGISAMNAALLDAIHPSLAIITAKDTRCVYARNQLKKLGISAASTSDTGVMLHTNGSVWIVQNFLPDP